MGVTEKVDQILYLPDGVKNHSGGSRLVFGDADASKVEERYWDDSSQRGY